MSGGGGGRSEDLRGGGGRGSTEILLVYLSKDDGTIAFSQCVNVSSAAVLIAAAFAEDPMVGAVLGVLVADLLAAVLPVGYEGRNPYSAALLAPKGRLWHRGGSARC